jgi:hypothetical protein
MSAVDRPPVNVFVAQAGNAFMRDIALWIVEAAQLSGRKAALVDDRLPANDGSINLVVAPHEFYLLRDDTDDEIRRAARCSVPVCTEQPGTPWFLLSLGFCVGSPLVLDINATGLDAIEREGFRARRLRLGGVAQMDRQAERAGDRDVDVVFMGGATERRAAVLAMLGPVLWDRNCELRTFTFSRPLSGDEPGVVFGDEKYDLLARSKILVNLHRSGDSDGYFEWARLVEAMANGCVVVTHPARGHEPLIAGDHFVETSIEALADTVISVLDDPARRHQVSRLAHEMVMDQLSLVDEVAELLDIIESEGLLVHSSESTKRWWERGRRTRTGRGPIPRTHQLPLLPVFVPYRQARRDVFDQLMAETLHRRELGRIRALHQHGDADHVTEYTTSTWVDADADVSVVVTLYNYADVVLETLDSIVASHDVDVEILIVDDNSSDAGLQTVRAWMRRNDEVPVMVLSCAANRGLGRARNLGLSRVRADRIMMMDADNHVYPTCLRRLNDALNADPAALFAYATLEAFGSDPGLRSAQGWFVPWLCDGNYIDAQAMLTRAALDLFGGYRIDDTMFGWEDWDLWLRIADAGGHGVHVPEMLGRYRTQESSMISLTNLVADDLRADLVARYPNLPWPELA